MPGIENSIDALLNQLSSPDYFEREDAVRQLGRMPHDEAIAGLVIALEDEDRGIRESAANMLVDMGGDTCSRLLANFMGHDEISVRNLAAEILVRIGIDAVPALLEATGDPHHDVRKFSLDVLGLIKDRSVMPQIIPMLADANDNVACSAAEALGNFGDASAVAPLLEAMRTREALRVPAAEALGSIGEAAALDGLREYLTTDDPVVLFSTIEALGRLRLPAAIADLSEFLDCDEQLIADAAIAAIIRIARANGRDSYENLPMGRFKRFLLDSLDSDDESVVQFALQELMHWNGPDIVAELISLLKKADGELLEQITDVLKSAGSSAVAALTQSLRESTEADKIKILDAIACSGDARMNDEVVRLAKSDNPDIRERVATTLGRCGSQDAIVILKRMATDRIGHVRAAAVKSIGWIGAEDKDVKALVQRLDDDYPDVREAAMGAMILVGGPKVIQTFTGDLDHENPERQRLAAIALGMIGEQETVAPLVTATSHSDPTVRRSAIEALVRIGELDDLSPIRAGLSDEDNLVRKAAVSAMVSFLGAQAVDDIKLLLDDDDLWVRYHTIDTIGGLGNPAYAELILPFLDDDQDIIKIAAVKALATLGDTSCVGRLQLVSSEGNRDLAEAIEDATRALTETHNG